MKWEDTALAGQPMRACLEPECPGPEGWRAMVYAPRDGSKVELLIEHRTWWAAHKCSPDEARIWRAICEGQWIDHNGGGWTWAGLSGTPIGWRVLKTHNMIVSDHECALKRGAVMCRECDLNTIEANSKTHNDRIQPP